MASPRLPLPLPFFQGTVRRFEILIRFLISCCKHGSDPSASKRFSHLAKRLFALFAAALCSKTSRSIGNLFQRRRLSSGCCLQHVLSINPSACTPCLAEFAHPDDRAILQDARIIFHNPL